jgi:hypothetical protein
MRFVNASPTGKNPRQGRTRRLVELQCEQLRRVWAFCKVAVGHSPTSSTAIIMPEVALEILLALPLVRLWCFFDGSELLLIDRALGSG